MAIGFMSFGGMLTGGDEAPKEVEQNTAQKKVEVGEDKIIKETKENTVSYNNAIINE